MKSRLAPSVLTSMAEIVASAVTTTLPARLNEPSNVSPVEAPATVPPFKVSKPMVELKPKPSTSAVPFSVKAGAIVEVTLPSRKPIPLLIAAFSWVPVSRMISLVLARAPSAPAIRVPALMRVLPV